MLVWGAFAFADRVKNWERGAPDRRRTTPKNAKRRLADFRAGVYMQTLLRDSAAGLMHSMIYFGFLALLGVTTVLEVDHQLPEDLKFLHGKTYMALLGLRRLRRRSCSSAASCWAIVRRYIQRPYRIRIKTKPEHALILGVFLAIGLTRLRRRGLPHRRGRQAELREVELHRLPDRADLRRDERRQPRAVAPDLVGRSTSSAFLAFLAILPITMLRHMFTSPLNMYLKDRERPKGAMQAMPNLTETSLETFGASSSRTSPGSSCSTPTPARCAVAAPACARRTPPASRSTRARSC